MFALNYTDYIVPLRESSWYANLQLQETDPPGGGLLCRGYHREIVFHGYELQSTDHHQIELRKSECRQSQECCRWVIHGVLQPGE